MTAKGQERSYLNCAANVGYSDIAAVGFLAANAAAESRYLPDGQFVGDLPDSTRAILRAFDALKPEVN